MKIYLLSDLHLEFTHFQPPSTDADVIVLAGDIHVGTDGIDWALKYFPDKPVIYVMGNHEFYGSNLQQTLKDIKHLTRDTNIHVLDKERVLINNVEFLGCTLWTDFDLTGCPQSSKNLSTRYISDYDLINYGPNSRRLTTRDTHSMHKSAVKWLQKQTKNHSNQRVIVTHHSPSPQSLPSDFVNKDLMAAYASNLHDLISNCSADLWLHGHIHANSDYLIDKTRIACNPRGYDKGANKNFVNDFVIEI